MKTSKSTSTGRRRSRAGTRSIVPPEKETVLNHKSSDNGLAEEFIYDEEEETFVEELPVDDDAIDRDAEDRQP